MEQTRLCQMFSSKSSFHSILKLATFVFFSAFTMDAIASNTKILDMPDSSTLDCENVTEGGTISANQTICLTGDSYPDPIVSDLLPQGGSGTLQYLWLQSHVPDYTPGDPNWSVIPNSNSPTYTPPYLTQTTYFIRCARRSGCDNYVGESNIVVINVSVPPVILDVMSYDATCYGYSNGGIVVSAFGGTGALSYEWTGGLPAVANPSAVPAGTYTLTVSDTYGCSVTTTVTINQPEEFTVDVSGTDPTCYDSTDGTVSYSANASSPYTALWSTGSTNSSMSNLGPGIYAVTLTNAEGCTASDQIELTAPQSPLSNVVVSNVTCHGDNNGYASVLVPGNIPPYSYAWGTGSGTSFSSSINNLGAGSYSVTVTDGNGCVDSETITITEPDAVVITSETYTDASCSNSNDGEAVLTIEGGSQPYVFNWSDGSHGNPANFPPGDYDVTVYDGFGCSVTTSFVIDSPEPFIASVNTPDDMLDCYGDSDGTSTASAAGGIAPYTYAWSNGQTTPTATGLDAGNHYVTITDANGCTAEATVTIFQPTLLTIQTSETAAACYQSPGGSGSVSASGGSPGYTYEWSNGATTADVSDLMPGDYTVTVTDASNCTATGSISIGQAPELFISASGIDAICYGSATGSGSVLASGGTPGYTYAWSNGLTGADVGGLVAGTYTVTATDANNCEISETITIGQPDELIATTSASGASCNGDSNGSVSVSATGGTPGYSYEWSNGDTSADIADLPAGTYTVTVTDNNDCTTEASVSIDEPEELVTQLSGTDPACAGDTNGSVTADVTGGTEPYTYLWSNGESGSSISGLAAGNYTLDVTDANGCASTASITLAEPEALAINASGTDAICYGGDEGSAQASAQGGTMPYAFLWSNGATEAQLSNLTAGDYSVIVTDANGCSAETVVTINQPDVLTIDVDGTDAACIGSDSGSATATGGGGTAPYTYAWSDGQTTAIATNLTAGNYSVIVTDANGCSITGNITLLNSYELSATLDSQNPSCNGFADGTATANPSNGVQPYTYAWSNGADGNTASGLTAGDYEVTVTDANNCSFVASVTLTEPDPLAVNIESVDVACAGGTGYATANPSGGTAPYSYTWSNGAVGQTNGDLTVGYYTVTVTDSQGCTTSGTVLITSPFELTVSIQPVEVGCNGDATGMAYAMPEGGTAPYSYAWSNNEFTQNILNISAGSYSVTVTDANNCSTVADVEVTEPAPLTGSLDVEDAGCNGASGSATANVSGGVPPYSYSWSNGDIGSPTIGGLSGGNVSVWITDANGCNTQFSGFVNSTDPLVVMASATGISCNGFSDGEASVTVSGGTAPYSYSWSNGQTTPTIGGLSVGAYTVVVTDASGCVAFGNTFVVEPFPLEVNMSSDDVNCNGESNGNAYAMPVGGTFPYSFVWDNGSTEQNLIGVPAGNYTVTLTDANNCQTSGSVNISESTPLTAVLNSENPVCGGVNGGSAVVIPSGGSGDYSYAWSNGATSAAITGLSEGFYAVTVTDSNNCYFIANTTLFAPAELTVSMSATDMSCFGVNDGTATATVSGGTGPYEYSWNNGETGTPVITGLSAQRYNVTITDANGCQVASGIFVYQPSQLTAAVTSESGCQGGVLGYASVAPQGGSFPYSYSWSNGENTPVIYNADGDYSVTVTDANSCSIVETISVSNTPAINLSIDGTNISCHGFTDGSAIATTTGGSGSYTYSWNNGGSAAGIYDLGAGSYNVTVTDASGCQAYGNIYINEPDPLYLGAYAGNASCSGAADASAHAQASGGTAPYSYNWSNGATGADISGLSAGTYFVTASDANNCETVMSVSVGETDPIVATATGTDSACAGSDSGSASVTATGGSGAYATYNWSNNDSGATIYNLAPGTYSVTVTDTNGCTGVASVTIGSGNEVAVDVTGTDASCGFDNGSANAAASGGNGNYTTYSWSNGASGNFIANLAAGTYTVTVYDSNGCSATGSTTIGSSPAVSVTTDATDVSCSDLGSATASADGGTAPFSYEWSNGSTDQTINDLYAGTYNVTITDANGCQAVGSADLQGALAPVLTETHTDVSCNGVADGYIGVAANGAAGPFQYLWDNGETSAELFGLSAGTYSLTVTDANLCESTIAVTINESSAIDLTTSSTPASCFDSNDGAATVSASGGAAPYTYDWNNNADTDTADQLAAGSYTVIVTDANNCTASATVEVTAPDELIVSGTVTSAACSSANDGGIDLDISGGSAPYAILWNNGETSANLSGLAAGTYSVTITDDNNCEAVASFDISGTDPVAAQIETTDPTEICVGDGNSDMIDVTATGGLGQSMGWIITDDAGNILDLPASPPFDFEGAGAGICLIWQISYDGTVSGLEIGSNASNLSGCFDLSNPITVTRNEANGGAIATNDPTEICVGDGEPDFVDVSLSGTSGSGSQWVITDDNGTILDLPAGPPFNFEGAGEGVCLIWHLSYDGAISGAAVGANAADITGCISLSNPITITRNSVNGGTISTNDPTVFCAGDGVADLVNVALSGNAGDNSQWIITDPLGNVLDLPDNPPFNFEGAPAGVCLIWHLSYPDGGAGVSIGSNLNSVSGCFALSNSIAVTRNNPIGGTISTNDPTEICSGDGIDNPIDVTLDGEVGDNSAWVITDADGNILALPAGPPFNLEGAGAGVCLIWHISWDENITGVAVGQNAADIQGCYDLSNPITITRTDENHIGDYVWNDVNANCIQDDNEYGVSGIPVQLIQAGNDGIYCTDDDIIVAETSTDNNGYYAFGCVAPGEYSVLFADIPTGYEFTCANTGDDSIDSDADANTGKTDAFTIVAGGDANFDLDAGIVAFCNNLTDGGSIAQSQTICQGNIPNLIGNTLTPVGGGGGDIEYLWMYTTTPGPFSAELWDPIPGATDINYQPGNIYQTTYFVRCSRREGCTNFVESNIVAITTVPIPTATINIPDEVCVGESYTIAASNAGAGVSYSWSIGGASPSSGNQQEVINVSWNNSGVQTITLTVTRGTCSHTESISIEVLDECQGVPSGLDGFIDFNARLMYTDDNDIMLDWSTTPELAQYEYFVEYSEDGVLFNTANQVSGKYNTQLVNNYDFMLENNPAGIVFVRIRRIAPDGTSIYSVVRQVVINPTNAEIFTIYPNPVYNELNVKLLEPLAQDATLQIVSVDGKVVRTMSIPKDMIEETISFAKYPKGMYIIRIVSDEIGSKAYKVTKVTN